MIGMPVTNAVSERSFSDMQRLLTYLRSSMSENRQNKWMVLHIQKEKRNNLSLIDTGNDFLGGSERRKSLSLCLNKVTYINHCPPKKPICTQVNVPQCNPSGCVAS